MTNNSWSDYKIENTGTKYFVPMRLQPVHIGHLQLLEELTKNATELVIGIGSANKVDQRNPYFAIEREMMLRYDLEQAGYNQDLILERIKIIQVPDFQTDKEWVQYLQNKEAVDNETIIVTGNPEVKTCFPENKVLTLEELLPNKHNICATKLREMIAEENPQWKNYATAGTQHYFEQFGGKERITKYN